MSFVLKTLSTIAIKAVAALGTQAMLEWLLFKVADMVVDSTKTNVDNEWLTKFKEEYKKVE